MRHSNKHNKLKSLYLRWWRTCWCFRPPQRKLSRCTRLWETKSRLQVWSWGPASLHKSETWAPPPCSRYDTCTAHHSLHNHQQFYLVCSSLFEVGNYVKKHTSAYCTFLTLSVMFWQMYFDYATVISMKGFETLCDPDVGSVAESTELMRWLTCALFGWQLLLEDRMNTSSLSQEVAVFVEMLWTEALGSFHRIFAVSVDKLSLNDVRLPPQIVLLLLSDWHVFILTSGEVSQLRLYPV